jgi:hypothetical protein
MFVPFNTLTTRNNSSQSPTSTYRIAAGRLWKSVKATRLGMSARLVWSRPVRKSVGVCQIWAAKDAATAEWTVQCI